MKAERKRSAFSMPQQIIDEVLTTGGNEKDSVINICTEYSKNKSSVENIEFLKDEYGTGGKGFIFDGNKVSVWWNTDGMRVAYGDTAIGKGQLLSWEQVDSRIKELLDLGRYAPQETLDNINDFERKKFASAFWYMHKDIDNEKYPELKYLFKDEWFEGGYPDSTDRIAEMLNNAENVNKFMSVLSTLKDKYADNRDIMRWRSYSPDKVLPLLEDLQRQHIIFTANDYKRNTAAPFITEDEIDKLFTRGSGMDRGKIRSYLYFQEHTDKKERIDFLKNEYGIGGYYSGIFNLDHNSKGINFSRGDLTAPYAKVNITWSAAEKRIDSLIKSGRYLTEREIAEDIPKYQAEQEQLRIRKEQINFLNDTEKLTPLERQKTIPKRFVYFINTIPYSEKYKLTLFEKSEIETVSEFKIIDLMLSDDTRKILIDDLKKMQATTGDVHTRSNAYRLANDLEAVKTISLQRVGDFYEVYGKAAEEAAKMLDLTLTSKTIDGEQLPMVGFPVSVAEKYSQILSENGCFVSFGDDSKEQQAVEKTFYKYALTIVSKVVNDKSYINACLNSDKENAELECDAAVKRAILTFSPENNSELYRLYFDMPEFQERIHEFSFEETYDIIRKNEMDVSSTDEPQQAQAQQDESYTVWVKSVITEYLEEEENTTADFSNMREVNILYTFADETILHLDESHTLRVDADLIDFKINRYIDDILIDSRPFEEFLDDSSMLSFGEMVGFSDEQIKQVKEKRQYPRADGGLFRIYRQRNYS